MLIPRPTTDHHNVKAAAVDAARADIVAWAAERGAKIGMTEAEDAAIEQITETLWKEPDPFKAGVILKEVGFPVDYALVKLLARIEASLSNFVAPFIHDWVMQTQTRFPAKQGQSVKFKRGDMASQGTVEAVIPSEARAIVSVQVTKAGYQNFSVNAEDVLKVMAGVVAKPKGGGGGPTGGTPAGGSVEKELKVA